MNDSNVSAPMRAVAFDDIKRRVARLMGIKRLGAGRVFQENVVAPDPFVGKRGHNMGDLWREPSDEWSSTDGALSESDVVGGLYEMESTGKR